MPPPQQGTGWIPSLLSTRRNLLIAIPIPCFTFIIKYFFRSPFFLWNSPFAVYSRLSKLASACSFTFRALYSSTNVISHSFSSHLSLCLRSLSLGCACIKTSPWLMTPTAGMPLPVAMKCSRQGCFSHVNVGVARHLCESGTRHLMLFSALNHDFSSLGGKGGRWDCYHPLV